jgi:hypothetical protein
MVSTLPSTLIKEEGSMVCEARLIDRMCSLSIYCLALCSHDQVVLLVLNGLGKLSVDVIRKRMLQDSATLKLFQFSHGWFDTLEIHQRDDGRAARSQTLTDGFQEIVVEAKVDVFAGSSATCCSKECAFDESST